MGIAHGELVHDGARLVGIDDHHFAGGQGAGEDPHAAGGGVRLRELLCLFPSTGTGWCLSTHYCSSNGGRVGGILESQDLALPVALGDLNVLPCRQDGENSELHIVPRSWHSRPPFLRGRLSSR